MRQGMVAIASLCMMAALCEQLLDGRRLFGAVRLVLGLEIVRTALELIDALLVRLG